MEDKDIIALYWARSEEAIRQTSEKYGAYCGQIIRRVLGDGRDAEECISDTWLGAWNAMPPQRPARLPPFLGRIARNTALDRYDYNSAQRRGSGFEAVLEELADCVGGTPLEEDFDLRRLGEAISAFLDTASPAARLVFLRRYWYCDAGGGVAPRTGVCPSKGKTPPPPAREGGKKEFREEGYDL